MSYYFGLHPWDIARLSIAEWNRYLEALDELAKR